MRQKKNGEEGCVVDGMDLMDVMDQMDRTAGSRKKKRATLIKRRPVDSNQFKLIQSIGSISSIGSIPSIQSIPSKLPSFYFPSFFSQSLRNAAIPLSVNG
jgi:hypothetical protein